MSIVKNNAIIIRDEESTPGSRTGARRFGLVGVSVALGAAALTGCGASPSDDVGAASTERDVSPNLSDPGVEFGGMPAPVGEPNWGALVVPELEVEFGGMPAPVGEPNWGALVDTAVESAPQHGPR